nr:hypothetical protein [Leeuwenhoekiella sp. MAR_2009_132]
MASTASDTVVTKNPEMPSAISLSILPRLNTMTGVPHNIASTILRPKRSSKEIGCSNALAIPEIYSALEEENQNGG